MKKKVKTLLICVLSPVMTGITASLLTGGVMETFKELNKPTLSPPGWLFPVVWTVLFILMGIASYFVVISGARQKYIISALKTYGLQLVVNFLWSFIFFTFEQYCLAFVWLLLLWVLILITIKKFWAVSMKAGVLLIPYLIWVTFAGYLNISICLLNK